MGGLAMPRANSALYVPHHRRHHQVYRSSAAKIFFYQYILESENQLASFDSLGRADAVRHFTPRAEPDYLAPRTDCVIPTAGMALGQMLHGQQRARNMIKAACGGRTMCEYAVGITPLMP